MRLAPSGRRTGTPENQVGTSASRLQPLSILMPSALQVINCVGTGILFVVLAADNMHLVLAQVLPSVSTEAWLTLSAVLALPFCFFRNLDDIGMVSFLGLTSSLLALGCIILNICFYSLPDRDRTVQFEQPTLDGVLSALAMSCFSYGGHLVFPGILRVMQVSLPCPLPMLFCLQSCSYVSPHAWALRALALALALALCCIPLPGNRGVQGIARGGMHLSRQVAGGGFQK